MAPTPSDFWHELRAFTSARIALGRTGSSLPTSRLLDFQLAHARARDAVRAELDVALVRKRLKKFGLPLVPLHSRATDRHAYLQHPDRGRQLDEASVRTLQRRARKPYDVSLVVADGLSALAIEQNVEPLLEELLPKVKAESLSLAPIALVQQGRVAIGDEIGQLLNSRIVAVLIGERPGLSSPDSLGIYLTYQPRVGLTDERRNCISNVRPAGLPYAFAAEKLTYLIRESLRRQLSGIGLKDETDTRWVNDIRSGNQDAN